MLLPDYAVFPISAKYRAKLVDVKSIHLKRFKHFFHSQGTAIAEAINFKERAGIKFV